MEQDKPRRKTPSMYSQLNPGEFITKRKDRKARLDQRHKWIKEAAQKGKDDDGDGDDNDDDKDEDEDETEKEKLECEMKELESQLKKAEWAEALARDKEEKKKATEFSKQIQKGKFLKQLQSVTLVKTRKKRKTLKTEAIRSADEEDEEDKIPEGFYLQAKFPHCLNMKWAEDFQAYLRQIVLEFKCILKAGWTDMRDTYGKIIESFYWACLVNKNTIIEAADRDQVLQSIRDPKCKAWKLKLNGRKMVDPTSLVDEGPIAPQTVLQIISMKPAEVWELVEEEMSAKKPEQVKMLKEMIKNICKSQVLAHRHAADVADHLVALTDVVSMLIALKVMNAMMRPVVAVKIPEVDDMMKQAQAKVEAIQEAKEACQGA